mmetsp:Transcript_23173/g.44109  ORF Transcript_23173/g.44109 Transcript_23173/m.44109 type:complete len:301 (+) Transcript_23173:373-1275(+)
MMPYDVQSMVLVYFNTLGDAHAAQRTMHEIQRSGRWNNCLVPYDTLNPNTSHARGPIPVPTRVEVIQRPRSTSNTNLAPVVPALIWAEDDFQAILNARRKRKSGEARDNQPPPTPLANPPAFQSAASLPQQSPQPSFAAPSLPLGESPSYALNTPRTSVPYYPNYTSPASVPPPFPSQTDSSPTFPGSSAHNSSQPPPPPQASISPNLQYPGGMYSQAGEHAYHESVRKAKSRKFMWVKGQAEDGSSSGAAASQPVGSSHAPTVPSHMNYSMPAQTYNQQPAAINSQIHWPPWTQQQNGN